MQLLAFIKLFILQRVKNLGPARTMVLYEAQVRLG